jgi:hypothetical protein
VYRAGAFYARCDCSIEFSIPPGPQLACLREEDFMEGALPCEGHDYRPCSCFKCNAIHKQLAIFFDDERFAGISRAQDILVNSRSEGKRAGHSVNRTKRALAIYDVADSRPQQLRARRSGQEKNAKPASHIKVFLW